MIAPEPAVGSDRIQLREYGFGGPTSACAVVAALLIVAIRTNPYEEAAVIFGASADAAWVRISTGAELAKPAGAVMDAVRETMSAVGRETGGQTHGTVTAAPCAPDERLVRHLDRNDAAGCICVLGSDRSYGAVVDLANGTCRLWSGTGDPLLPELEGRVRAVLSGLAAAPATEVGRMDLFQGGERARVEGFGRGPVRKPGPALGLLELFARRVETDGDRIALSDGERALTYAEIRLLARRVAARLAAAGAGPGTVIGVALPRSIELSATVLAILHLNAVYLPLDTTHPPMRLNFIAEDAGATLIVTSRAMQDLLRPSSEPAIILVDEMEASADPGPAIGAGCRADADDPLYIIYTSGSTGRPKGVRITHRQTLNRFHWMWRRFPFDRDSVFALKTAPGFVDSIWELLGVLIGGCHGVILPDERVRDPRVLVRTLSETGVTRIWLVPTLLKVLLELDMDIGRELSKLTHWVSTGEILLAGLQRRFHERLPKAELHNLYGSSEFGDICWLAPGDLGRQAGLTLPIGRPIDNLRVLVLDPMDQPVPIGAWGELCVVMAGLPREYINRPESTRKTFATVVLPDGEALSVGRTGDLCRWRPDGLLEIAGRLDSQIKIRGGRVDCLEVENVLIGDTCVAEAAVIALPLPDNNFKLTAFIVPVRSEVADTDLVRHIRKRLRTLLPIYAVPSAIVTRRTLPKTASGKIDRQRLAANEGDGDDHA